MRMTGRQKSFLSQFLDLFREAREPLHYTTVAQHLGVSKITAYDMLRLLEERGLVQSDYILRGKGRGAGRSSIVFRPTPQADALFAELSSEAGHLEEWETIKMRVLEALQAGDKRRYQDLVEEILARLPSCKSPLLYAAEMITAVILSLRQLQEEASAAGLFDRVRSLGLPGEAGLSALGGLALGLSFVEQVNQGLIVQLLSYLTRYQEIIANLSAESKQRLANFAGEVMRVVEA